MVYIIIYKQENFKTILFSFFSQLLKTFSFYALYHSKERYFYGNREFKGYLGTILQSTFFVSNYA